MHAALHVLLQRIEGGLVTSLGVGAPLSASLWNLKIALHAAQSANLGELFNQLMLFLVSHIPTEMRHRYYEIQSVDEVGLVMRDKLYCMGKGGKKRMC